MIDSHPSQYHELADLYDPLNSWKDYASETKRIEAIAQRFGRPGKTSWLDVGCGTGRHLEFLRQRHRVMGVDGSPDMLRIAKRRLPGVRLVMADMRTFRLRREFDVVSCLFSAIGHLPTEFAIQSAFANFAEHLSPGGVVIVEPWIDPSSFHSGSVHMRTFESPELMLARCAYSKRRGSHSVITYDYLVGRAGRGVRRFRVRDVGLLVPRGRLIQLIEGAGLRARSLAKSSHHWICRLV